MGEDGFLPKTIYMLWLQGWETAPELVQSCAESWERQNTGWRVVRLEQADVARLVTSRHLHLPPAALSDLVRLELLHDSGGVWADATTFCWRPLDDWLTQASEGGFFAFSRPALSTSVSSWFLAARPGSAVVTAWRNAAVQYWEGREASSDYFWLHGLFDESVRQSGDAAREWCRTARISADGPHYFARYGSRFQGPISPRAKARLAAHRDPMYKLTHKVSPERCSETSAYRYFAAGAAEEFTSSRLLTAVDQPLEKARWSALKVSHSVRLLLRRIRASSRSRLLRRADGS